MQWDSPLLFRGKNQTQFGLHLEAWTKDDRTYFVLRKRLQASKSPLCLLPKVSAPKVRHRFRLSL